MGQKLLVGFVRLLFGASCGEIVRDMAQILRRMPRLVALSLAVVQPFRPHAVHLLHHLDSFCAWPHGFSPLVSLVQRGTFLSSTDVVNVMVGLEECWMNVATPGYSSIPKVTARRPCGRRRSGANRYRPAVMSRL